MLARRSSLWKGGLRDRFRQGGCLLTRTRAALDASQALRPAKRSDRAVRWQHGARRAATVAGAGLPHCPRSRAGRPGWRVAGQPGRKARPSSGGRAVACRTASPGPGCQGRGAREMVDCRRSATRQPTIEPVPEEDQPKGAWLARMKSGVGTIVRAVIYGVRQGNRSPGRPIQGAAVGRGVVNGPANCQQEARPEPCPRRLARTPTGKAPVPPARSERARPFPGAPERGGMGTVAHPVVTSRARPCRARSGCRGRSRR